MFRRHTLAVHEKFFNSFLHDFLQISALAHCIFENIELEQLAHILDTLLRIHHEHLYQKIHEALRNFSILVQLVCVWMVFKELRVSWLKC